jgi:hypothetical protein
VKDEKEFTMVEMTYNKKTKEYGYRTVFNYLYGGIPVKSDPSFAFSLEFYGTIQDNGIKDILILTTYNGDKDILSAEKNELSIQVDDTIYNLSVKVIDKDQWVSRNSSGVVVSRGDFLISGMIIDFIDTDLELEFVEKLNNAKSINITKLGTQNSAPWYFGKRNFDAIHTFWEYFEKKEIYGKTIF